MSTWTTPAMAPGIPPPRPRFPAFNRILFREGGLRLKGSLSCRSDSLGASTPLRLAGREEAVSSVSWGRVMLVAEAKNGKGVVLMCEFGVPMRELEGRKERRTMNARRKRRGGRCWRILLLHFRRWK